MLICKGLLDYMRSLFFEGKNNYCVLSIGDVWSTLFTNQGELSVYCWSLLCSFGSLWVSWLSISSYWWLSTILHQIGLLLLWVSAPDDNFSVQVVFPCRIRIYQLSLFSLAATVNYIFAIIYVLFTLLLLYGVGPRVFFSSSRRILTFTVRYLSVDITGTYFRYNNQLIYYQILFQEVNLSLCSHPGCLGIGVATLFFFLGDEVGCFLHRYLRIRTQLALCVLSYRFPSPNSFNLLDFGDSLFSEWPQKWFLCIKYFLGEDIPRPHLVLHAPILLPRAHKNGRLE